MRGATAVRVVLAVILVAVLASVTAVRPNRIAAAIPDWQPYIDAGRTMALALTTVDYRTVDRDIQRILDNAASPFYDDFSGRSAGFAQVVRAAESTSTSTVNDARLESHDAGLARILVGLTTTTINAGQPDPHVRDWRLRITVQKIGESYKASNVEFLR
jgi:hypothetical protein